MDNISNKLLQLYSKVVGNPKDNFSWTKTPSSTLPISINWFLFLLLFHIKFKYYFNIRTPNATRQTRITYPQSPFPFIHINKFPICPWFEYFMCVKPRILCSKDIIFVRVFVARSSAYFFFFLFFFWWFRVYTHSISCECIKEFW